MLAAYTLDYNVYRASVEEIFKNQDTGVTCFKVRFIDYGNTCMITEDLLFKWDSVLDTIPPQAFCLKLKDCSRIKSLVDEGSKLYQEFNSVLRERNPYELCVVERLRSSSIFSRPHVYTPELLVTLHSSGRSIFRILKSSSMFRDCITEAPATTFSLTRSVVETLNQDRLKILEHETPARLSQVPEPVHLTDGSPGDDDTMSRVHPVLASRAVEKVTEWMTRYDTDNTTDDAANHPDQHEEEVDLEAPVSPARRKPTVEKKVFIDPQEASSEVCKTSTLSLQMKNPRQACNSDKAGSEPAVVSTAPAKDGHLGARPKSSTAAKTPSSGSMKSRILEDTEELLKNAKIKRKGETDASLGTSKNQRGVFTHSSIDGVDFPSRKPHHQHASQAELLNTKDDASQEDALNTHGDFNQADLNSCVHQSEAEDPNTNVDSSQVNDAHSRQADSHSVKSWKSPLTIKQQRIQVAFTI